MQFKPAFSISLTGKEHWHVVLKLKRCCFHCLVLINLFILLVWRVCVFAALCVASVWYEADVVRHSAEWIFGWVGEGCPGQRSLLGRAVLCLAQSLLECCVCLCCREETTSPSPPHLLWRWFQHTCALMIFRAQSVQAGGFNSACVFVVKNSIKYIIQRVLLAHVCSWRCPV